MRCAWEGGLPGSMVAQTEQNFILETSERLGKENRE